MTWYCTFDPNRPLDPRSGGFLPLSWQATLRSHCRSWVELRWNQYRTVLACPEPQDRVVTEPDMIQDVRALETMYERIGNDLDLLEDQVIPDDYVSIATEAMVQGLSILSLDVPMTEEGEWDETEDGLDHVSLHSAYELPDETIEDELDETTIRHGQAAPTLLPERHVVTRIAYERSVYLSSPPERTGITPNGPRVTRYRRCLHPDGTIQYGAMRIPYPTRVRIATIYLEPYEPAPQAPWFYDDDPYRHSFHEDDTVERTDRRGSQRRCQCSLQDPRRPVDRTRPNCSRWDADGDDRHFDFTHRWFEAVMEPYQERLRGLTIRER